MAVTGVTLSPKTSSAEAGTAGTRQLTATVAPTNATNKSVSYAIVPTTNGLSVNASGLISWNEDVPAGTYTTTVTTADGAKKDTHVLTLAEPEPDPPPEGE
ncbi:phage tail protein [Siminovitchia terrae]|uniref:Phage tail protein n=1 Tax=Siminovitchia terrae TaxID=1914933 RepID=A0A429X2V2_SIMTE|nr:phage tail protein [Siminovitchia terrae]